MTKNGNALIPAHGGKCYVYTPPNINNHNTYDYNMSIKNGIWSIKYRYTLISLYFLSGLSFNFLNTNIVT